MLQCLQRANVARLAAGLVCTFILAGCSDDSDGVGRPTKPQATNPTVEGPVTGGGGDDCCVITLFGLEVDLRDQGYTPGTPFYSGFLYYDLADIGYRETEYFISGTAQSYVATEEPGADGVWPVQPADAAAYRTRIVVQRPIDEAAFNGTLVVEWFNVTGGLDASPDWSAMHTELTREGYAWMGVSAQSVGVEGGGAFDIPLKLVDPTRYGSLNHPGDSFSYDIFSQATQAARNPVGLDPLEGLEVERVIAVGQSQSAGRLVTYFNSVHPTIALFDAFLIHSRGSRASAISQEPQVDIPVPQPALLRTDLPEPAITLQAETDIFNLNSVAIRQGDSDTIRLWEVAGTAHSDIYTTLKSGGDKGDDPTVADVIAEKGVRPPFINCSIAANDGPMHWVAKATVHALDQWVRTGDAPPSAPLLAIDEQAESFLYDNVGNVQGGIRTPYVDAPVAVLHGEGQPAGNSFCSLFGTTELFDDALLAELYPDKAAYVSAIEEASDAAVAAGFLRPADADLIKARARSSDIAAP